MRLLLFAAIALLLSLSYTKVHPEAKLPFQDYCRYFGYPS